MIEIKKQMHFKNLAQPYKKETQNDQADFEALMPGTEDMKTKSFRLQKNTIYEAANFKIEHSKDFSENNPVFKVTLFLADDNTKEYNINVKQMDIHNASELEMYVYCYSVDEREQREKGSTWNSFNNFIGKEVHNFKLGHINEDLQALTKYNWTKMLNSAIDGYTEKGMYEQTLEGQKIQSRLNKYSKPPVYGKITEIGIINMNQGTSLYISDDGELTCIDEKAEGNLLWKRELSEEDFFKCNVITKNKNYASFMYDSSFWDHYLNSDITYDDLVQFDRTLKKMTEYKVFEGSEDIVVSAWKKAQEEMDFNALGWNNNGQLEYISEFVKLLFLNQKKGSDQKTFGSTVNSAVQFAKNIISSIEQLSLSEMSKENIQIKNKEKEFYHTFIKELLEQERRKNEKE